VLAQAVPSAFGAIKQGQASFPVLAPNSFVSGTLLCLFLPKTLFKSNDGLTLFVPESAFEGGLRLSLFFFPFNCIC